MTGLFLYFLVFAYISYYCITGWKAQMLRECVRVFVVYSCFILSLAVLFRLASSRLCMDLSCVFLCCVVVLSCLVLSCLSCLILSCLVLSCHVLSCLAFWLPCLLCSMLVGFVTRVLYCIVLHCTVLSRLVADLRMNEWAEMVSICVTLWPTFCVTTITSAWLKLVYPPSPNPYTKSKP